MIIYLSGPDGAGKTTMAKELVALTKGYYKKWGPPPSEMPPQQLYKAAMEDLRLDTRQALPVIYDRGPWGSYIYHELIPQRPWSSTMVLAYAKEFTRAGNLIYYVTTPFENAIARLEKRGDEYLGGNLRPNLKHVYEKYEAMFTMFKQQNIPFYKIIS